MSNELRRRAAFWGNLSGGLDYLIKEITTPYGEKWPDDEDKKVLDGLVQDMKKALRIVRTRYIGVLMVQTAEEAENAENNDTETKKNILEEKADTNCE